MFSVRLCDLDKRCTRSESKKEAYISSSNLTKEQDRDKIRRTGKNMRVLGGV